MGLISKTTDGKMPSRNTLSWRTGQIEDDLSLLRTQADKGDLDAIARLKMLGMYITPTVANSKTK